MLKLNNCLIMKLGIENINLSQLMATLLLTHLLMHLQPMQLLPDL